MTEARSQFTFYDSFYRALSRIKKKADRADAYDLICRYALYGELPDIEALQDSVAVAFEVVKPNLDASRRKAESGKKGGKIKQTASKPKQSGSKRKQTQANSKQEQEKEQVKEQEKEQMLYTPLPPKGEASALFALFWEAYPKKKGKADAEKAFAKAIKKADLQTMITAIRTQSLSSEWQKDGGQFIPYPATWLNGCRWEDEQATETAAPGYVPIPDSIPDCE